MDRLYAQREFHRSPKRYAPSPSRIESSTRHYLILSRVSEPLKMQPACNESSASTRNSLEGPHQNQSPRASLDGTKLVTSARSHPQCVSWPNTWRLVVSILTIGYIALVHVIVGLMLLGYGQEYYFHLSMPLV